MRIEMRDALERPNVLRTMTGLNPEEFQRLSSVFGEEWERETERNWQGQPRSYAKGGGPKGALDTAEMKLLFILMYLRVYPIQEVMGFFFGFNQCQANKWIMRLLPVLHRALQRLAALPVRQPAALEQVLAQCRDLRLRLDGTERPIRRPKNPEKQRICYSGRKKRHTVKNLVLTEERSVEFLSPTAPGSKHDKTLAEPLEAVRFPERSVVVTDTGFKGLALQDNVLIHPRKKPQGAQLPLIFRQANHIISSVRAKVEHVIGGIKRWRIVSDVFRNIKAGLDDLAMYVACGLHNFVEECRAPTRAAANREICFSA
jgi:DDE superfamily endonuclease/Helix-turn-helix of DDE superfamily endonuclease